MVLEAIFCMKIGEKFLPHRSEVKRGTSLIMGMPAKEQEMRIPHIATKEDIPGWMALVDEVSGSFPGLNPRDMKNCC